MLPSLLLFARVPEPGRVKTRLAGRLTERGATELYRAFLEDAARVYLRPSRWESVLCAEPDPLDARLAALFPPAWRREPQAPGDLGSKLRTAFAGAFGRGAPAAVAIGSDHPALPLRSVEALFGELEAGRSAAVVPAEDGGYCAIGLSAGASAADVFRGIPWSTETVLSETLRRFGDAGLACRVLDPAYDVDRPEDLDRLRRDLAGRDARDEDYPAATARALATLAAAGSFP